MIPRCRQATLWLRGPLHIKAGFNNVLKALPIAGLFAFL